MFQIRLLTLLLALFLVQPVLAADAPAADTKADGSTAEHVVDSADTPLVSVQIRELMQDRKYDEAVVAIDAAMTGDEAPKDYLGYLKGRALYLDNRFDEAVAVYRQVQQEFPNSEWRYRALFGEALAYARKGEFQKAEGIYRKQAEYLLSLDRKQQLAEIYLEFADRYFAPTKKPNSKPDYEKALVFYLKALEVGPKQEEQERIELQFACCHQELGRHDDAAKLYRKFLGDHKKSSLDVEVRFRLGQVELAMGQQKETRANVAGFAFRARGFVFGADC